ncbi:MAG TPA: glycosyltransferase, partial [Candidatus Humimicrobiaceae bacterium]
MQHNILKNPVDFSILIPSYNEEANISATIAETVKVLEAFNPSYEIIVIDDGSRDKTRQKVADIISSGNSKVQIQSYFPNRGKGYALKYGTDFASGNLILFLDADLDLHPSQLIEMY